MPDLRSLKTRPCCPPQLFQGSISRIRKASTSALRGSVPISLATMPEDALSTWKQPGDGFAPISPKRQQERVLCQLVAMSQIHLAPKPAGTSLCMIAGIRLHGNWVAWQSLTCIQVAVVVADSQS